MKYDGLDIKEKICLASVEDKKGATPNDVHETLTNTKRINAPNTGVVRYDDILGYGSIALGLVLAVVSWKIYKK